MGFQLGSALLLSGADSPGIADLLIAGFGATGVMGAIAAIVKFRGERDSLAVSQAQGAMETMEQLNEALERALARADRRGDFYKTQYHQALAERNDLVQRWGPFPDADVFVEPIDDPAPNP